MRVPRGKWNGRVSDLTMKEYRDMKQLGGPHLNVAMFVTPNLGTPHSSFKVGNGRCGLSSTNLEQLSMALVVRRVLEKKCM